MNKYEVNIIEESKNGLYVTFTDPYLQDPPFYCALCFILDDGRPQFPLKYFKTQNMYIDSEEGCFLFCVDNNNSYWSADYGYGTCFLERSDKETVEETLELYKDQLDFESLKVDLILKEIEAL